MLDVKGERSRTERAIPQRSRLAEAPGKETGSEGTKQVSLLCACGRHHDRLSKALLVSPHYDAGSTSLTVTHRSNNNSPAK